MQIFETMGTFGWIAFGIVLLLAIGIGIPGIAHGVMAGFQTIAHSPLVAQAIGSVHAWLTSNAFGRS